MRLIYIMGLCVLLGACASYRPVGNSDVVNPLPSDYSPEHSVKVTMRRDNSFVGGALDGHFYFDEEFVVTLPQGKTYSFYTTPGEHAICVNIGNMPMSFYDASIVNNALVDFKADRHYVYFLTPKAGSGLIIVEEKNEALK